MPRRATGPASALLAPRTLVEVFVRPRDAGAVGFALAQIARAGRLLWIQDRMAAMEGGLPSAAAFARFGGTAERLVLACGRRASDVLWTMEEGLRCASLAAIIGEIWGDPSALDFTATRRLALRAERQGVSVFLVRFAAAPSLSAARQRWCIASLPSAPHPYDPRAPGAPRWRAELFRTRGMRPGTWEVSYDRKAHRLDLVSAFRDPTLETAVSDQAGIAGAGGHRAVAGRRAWPGHP